MLNSSKEKINKLAWLNQRRKINSIPRLKVQKFLYFYEMFQKISGNVFEIDSLKAYRNGPVFSEVYGDINYRELEVYDAISSIQSPEINRETAEQALFIIDTMSERELSELTHTFDMWNSKKQRIERGEKHIPIVDSDITARDIATLKQISPEYPLENSDYHVIDMQNKKFVVSASDYKKLSEIHYDLLEQLSNEDSLFNPVYISIEEDGGLLVD